MQQVQFFKNDCVQTISKMIGDKFYTSVLLKDIFLGMIWGQYPNHKGAKTSQNGVHVYHSQFLSSTFWCKFHENPTKIAKLQTIQSAAML